MCLAPWGNILSRLSNVHGCTSDCIGRSDHGRSMVTRPIHYIERRAVHTKRNGRIRVHV